LQVTGAASLACGLISIGSCNGDVTSTILQTLIEKSEKGGADLKDTNARYLALGLGLSYLGKQESVDTILAALEVVPDPFRSFASTLVEVCAYAGWYIFLFFNHFSQS
jgi:26S proteasome regulatory subunit N1